MKSLILTGVALSSILFLSSCDKAKIDVSFNLDVANIYLSVPVNSTTGTMTLATTTFTSDMQNQLSSHNASLDDVQSIELTGAQFIMIDPGAQNFDIVDKAYAYLSTSTMAEKRVAYKDSVPNGVTQFSLNVDGGDLKEYLKSTSINFKATGFTNGANTEKDSLKVILSFNIKAKVKP